MSAERLDLFVIRALQLGFMLFFCCCHSRALAAICSPKFLSCPCGKTQDRIVIAVKLCGNENTNNANCEACDGIADSDRCSYFFNCTTCITEPNDCPHCSLGKFNGRYRKDCSWRMLSNHQRVDECQCYSTYRGNLALTPVSQPFDSGSASVQESENSCGRPSDPKNGYVKSEDSVFHPGDLVRYRCKEGYTMVGRHVRKCSNNLRWNGAQPTCVKACIWPLGWRPSGGGSPYVPENATMYLECNDGYDLVGPKDVTCLRGGLWNVDFPLCSPSVRTSNEPAPPIKSPNEPVEPVTNPEEPEPEVATTLRPVRFPPRTNPAVLPSTTTQATIPEPSAQPRPGEISSNSNQTDDNCNPGSILTYSCNHPYEVDGQPLKQCLPNGKWDTPVPKCKLICGKNVEPKTPQIVNGSSAQINEFPWQVALTSYGSTGEFRFIYCGGVLISDKWVLTAAHCITEDRSKRMLDAKTLLLLFAKHYADRNIDNNDVIQRKASRLVLNPNYDPFSFDSDLGLILLEEVVQINTVVMPLCLPGINSVTTFEEGRKGLVAGWGDVDNRGSSPSVLMMIELPIVSSVKCEASYREHNFKTTVTENMFCAGVDEGGKNTCKGDSGGAMAFYEDSHYVLEGIVSWGNKDDCAAPGFFGGFVRVRNYMHWISAFVPSP